MKKSTLMSGMAIAMAGACLPAIAADTAAAPENSSALRVSRDSATGALRAPTAEEHEALGQRARRAARQHAHQGDAPLLRAHHGGAHSMRMTDEMSTNVVAVRRVNGQVATQCFDSKAQANAAVSMAMTTTSQEASE